MKIILSKFVLILFVLIYAQLSFAQLTAWNFDWDDNILFMPTKIVLFKKGSYEEREISTGEFAEHKKIIGVSGEFSEYQQLFDTTHNSFRYFRDKPGENYFLKHLREIFEGGKTVEALGPSFKRFQFALSHPETARWTTIITSRGHSRANILEGLVYLKNLGLIKYLPPAENLFAVTSEEVRDFFRREFAMDTPKDLGVAKTLIMEHQLTKLNMEPVEAPGLRHFWGFSDDDFAFFKTPIDKLGPQIERWMNVKATIYYTGPLKIEHPNIVLVSNGVTRPMHPSEKYEARDRALVQHAKSILCAKTLIIP